MLLNHHILLAMITLAIRYIQKYTNEDVPNGTKTVHDFNDGQGEVPAVPYDETLVNDSIISFADSTVDSCSIKDSVMSFGTVTNDEAVARDTFMEYRTATNDTASITDGLVEYRTATVDMAGMNDSIVSFAEVSV